jgi:uncharacterized membrane protein
MAKTNHVIIAYFDNKDQAATVADEIKDWDKANDAIKLGGIGVLTWKGGKVKTQKVSRASGRRGAKWGLALGAAAGILSGGVTLVGGAVAGAAVGAVGAKLFHKSLGLGDADEARLKQKLSEGKAALVVMATEDEVDATKAELATLGGQVEDYQVPAETMAAVEEATEVKEEAAEVAEPAAEAEAAPEPDAPRVVRMPGTLESVEGIGPAHVATLKAAGITTKRRLLLAGATPEGRARVAKETKISEKLIMKWVSAVDLARVTGVKAQFSELLVAGGVLTVGQLAEQEAGELRGRLAELNKQKNITRLVPGTTQLGKWIEEAKGLPQLVTL